MQPGQPALTRSRLSWVEQNYLRADTRTAANSRLVDAQTDIGLAQAWDGGRVASADGLRLVVPVRTLNADLIGGHRGLLEVGGEGCTANAGRPAACDLLSDTGRTVRSMTPEDQVQQLVARLIRVENTGTRVAPQVLRRLLVMAAGEEIVYLDGYSYSAGYQRSSGEVLAFTPTRVLYAHANNSPISPDSAQGQPSSVTIETCASDLVGVAFGDTATRGTTTTRGCTGCPMAARRSRAPWRCG